MNRRIRGYLLPPAAVLFAVGILIGRVSVAPWLALAGLLLSLIAFFCTRQWFRYAATMSLVLCLGTFWGYISFHPALPEEGMVQVTGVISDEIRTGPNGQYKTVLRNLTLDGKNFGPGAYWSFYAGERPEGLEPGALVTVYASLYHPSGATNPDGYNFKEELLRRNVLIGLYGKVNLTFSEAPFSFDGFTASLRNSIRQELVRVMGEEAGGYAATMLLGFRSLIADADRQAFSRLGIAHVLAVSGFHTGILVAMLAFVFRLLRLPQRWRLILYAVFLTLYSALCGWNMPVVRASLLVLLALYGRISARPRIGLYLLSAAWILMLAISPVQLTGLSFLLSFGAMLGLVWVTPFLNSLLHPHDPISRSLWSGLSAGIGAQLGVLVPELSAFQTLPLLALLINIPVSLLATGMILLYWAVALLLPFPALCEPVAYVATGLTWFFSDLIRVLGSKDWIVFWTGAATWITGIGVALVFGGLCYFLRYKARTRLILLFSGILISLVSILPFPHTATEYIQFDSGNADAAVLWDKDTVWVIDAGLDDHVVSSFLYRRRLTPDAVVLTHLHGDHVLGLTSLLDNGIPVPVCFLPSGAEDGLIDDSVVQVIDRLRRSGTEIRYLSRGDRLDLPSGSFTVLWPEKDKVRPGKEVNRYSMTAALRLRDTTMLLTGDLDGRYELYAAAPADILKVAHHGSPSSSSPEFIAGVDPSLMLLSCNTVTRHRAFAERYPHIPLYSTAVSGALTLRFEDTGVYSVHPFLSRSQIYGGDPVESE